MHTARTLVRLLLRSLEHGDLLIQRRPQRGHQGHGDAQAAGNADFGRPSFGGVSAEGNGGPALNDPGIHKNLGHSWLDQKWIADRNSSLSEFYGASYIGSLNPSFVSQLQSLPDGMNKHLVGQLPSKSRGSA